MVYILQLQKQLKEILNILKTTPMNIAMCATLNHSGTIVTDPLRDVLTKKIYPTAKEMAENIGSHFLAILVQAGIAHYDLRKFRVRLNDVTKIESKEKLKEKKLKKKATEREVASEESSGEAEDKIEKDVLNSLVEQLELPDVDTLQAFLKKDFESLDELQFLFLQSVLKDLWVLQKWNQPLNYAQERKLSLTETHLKHLSDDEDNRLAGGVTSQSLIPKGASFSILKKTVQATIPLVSTSSTPIRIVNGQIDTPKGVGNTVSSKLSKSAASSTKLVDKEPYGSGFRIGKKSITQPDGK